MEAPQAPRRYRDADAEEVEYMEGVSPSLSDFLGCLGSVVSSPTGSGAEPRPKTGFQSINQSINQSIRLFQTTWFI